MADLNVYRVAKGTIVDIDICEVLSRSQLRARWR
jgi:hypothetical protein